MKTGDLIIEAARKQAEGQVAVHQANIEVYKTMPSGIGEHSDITEAVTGQIRWRFVGEDPEVYGWPNYGNLIPSDECPEETTSPE